MPKVFNKIILSFLASLVVLFSFGNFLVASAATTESKSTPKPSSAPTAPAEGNWYNQDFGSWYGKVYDDSNPSEIFGERYTAAQVQWVVYSLFAFILNSTSNSHVLSCILKNTTDLTVCAKAISTASIDQPIQAMVPPTKQQSLLSLVFDTNRSFSGIGYVKQKVQKFSLVPVAEAAPSVGFGFTALEPIQNMWRASRDVSFGLFVLVAIVFAFMIMFRVKISPQVIISVQSAIPKIITALVLVTFSYAIAGFLIDLMYIVIGIISVIFSGFLPVRDSLVTVGIFNFLTVGQPFGQGVQVGVLGLLYIYLLVLPIVFSFLLFMTIGAVASAIIAIIAAVGLGALLGTPVVGAITVIIGVILATILVILLIWNTIKVFWTLLKAFVNILLLTIFAPLQIVAGTFIPNFGFGSWIKNFVSNLAVFVVTGVLILFSYIFLYQGAFIGLNGLMDDGILNSIFELLFGSIAGSFSPLSSGSSSWPPLLGVGKEGSVTGLLFVGASFVVFTLIPKTADIIQSFMAGKPFAYESGIGEAYGPFKKAINYGLGSYGSAQMEEGEQEYKAGERGIGKAKIKKGALLREAQSFFK